MNSNISVDVIELNKFHNLYNRYGQRIMVISKCVIQQCESSISRVDFKLRRYVYVQASMSELERKIKEVRQLLQQISIENSELVLDIKNASQLYKKTEQMEKQMLNQLQLGSESKFKYKQQSLVKTMMQIIDLALMEKSKEVSSDYDGSLGYKLKYKIGEPEQPTWKEGYQYDADYKYNPDEKPTMQDRINWVKWKMLNEGGEWLGPEIGRNISDAIRAYEHYRSGKGTDLKIDYKKAYNEDKNIRLEVDTYIEDTKRVVEQLYAETGERNFSITGELLPVGAKHYPSTENWQKTIGAHFIWISADVEVDDVGNISMKTTIHEIDRYNFNKGMADIASGAPDDENGRFEKIGWANSFNTIGQFDTTVEWKQGEYDEVGSINDNDSGRREGRREGRDDRREARR